MNVVEILSKPRTALHLDSVDDYLGPSTTRFFGSGFRKVGYSWRSASVDQAVGLGAVRATASVDYPEDWSRKAEETQLRPHLSTIDVLILGVRAAELSLARGGVLLKDDGVAWLRQVDIKAGLTPVEDRLDEFCVEAAIIRTQSIPGSPAISVSTVLGAVAGMTVRCEVQHGRANPTSAAEAPAVALVGQPERDNAGWYGDGYRHRRQAVREVLVDATGDHADAMLTVAPGVEAPVAVARHGRIDTAPVAAVSMLDSFVTSLQLGQILLYEADRVPRAESNTLWMRNTTISTDAPHRRAVGSFPVSASLVDSRRIVARGETWRTATIFGACRGVQTRCAVAHRIPSGK
jgi:Pseudomonas avirulence D protein (AvrD)